MVSKQGNLIRLRGSIQEYDWGKTGSASLAARLAANALGPDFKVQEDTSYAEIWMGTHQNGPAHLFSDPKTSLLELIESDPKRYLGEALLNKWPGTKHVPFLFKILSVEKALPLQVHPDRELATELAKRDPENFVDPNHKPEIAVSIGEPLDGEAWGEGVAFTGFVGFLPLDAIRANVESVPELCEAIGDNGAVAAFVSGPSKDTLKKMYATLLGRSQDAVTPIVRKLVDRFKDNTSETARLVLKIDAQYPGDVGVLSTVFFMNLVKLRRGESVAIGADEIHAYLEGDIIECMAVSDNVMNAGFVPPGERQTADFVRALTFTSREAAQWRLEPQQYTKGTNGKTQVYAPPFDEFVVLGTALEGSDREELAAVNGPTIGIVTKGRLTVAVLDERMDLEEGTIVYVVPGNDTQVALSQGSSRGEIWWAAAGV